MIRVRELFFVSVLVQFGDTDLIQFFFRVYRIKNVGFRGVYSDNAKQSKRFVRKFVEDQQLGQGLCSIYFLLLYIAPSVYYLSLTFVLCIACTVLVPPDPGQARSRRASPLQSGLLYTAYASIPGP